MNNTDKVPRVGVGVILFNPVPSFWDTPEILLGLRLHKEGHGDKEWAFPGGKLEWQETIEACAWRETREETGLNIGNIIQLGTTNDFWYPPVDKHFLTVYVTGTVINTPGEIARPAVMEPTKCLEWRYFSVRLLPKNMMLGSTEILRKLFPSKFYQLSHI